MEKLNNGRKNTSKVYFLNPENKKKLKGLKNVLYSEEKPYAIVYTDEDLNYIDLLDEYQERNHNWYRGSNEDFLINKTMLQYLKVNQVLNKVIKLKTLTITCMLMVTI